MAYKKISCEEAQRRGSEWLSVYVFEDKRLDFDSEDEADPLMEANHHLSKCANAECKELIALLTEDWAPEDFQVREADKVLKWCGESPEQD